MIRFFEAVGMKSVCDINELQEALISEKEHFFYKMCDELLKSKTDVVIWGTYNNARKMFKFLNKMGVNSIKACVVNEEYLGTGINEVKASSEFPICSLESWLASHDKTSIVVDFSFFKKSLIEEYENKIDTIYVGDNMGVFIFDEPYIISDILYSSQKDNLKKAYSIWYDEASKKEFLEFIYQKNTGCYEKTHHEIQYFDNEIVRLCDNEVYVDCGAYDGDTIRQFIGKVSAYDEIFAFEMDKSNYDRLQNNTLDYHSCKIYNCGVGNSTEKLPASVGKNTASYIGNGEELVSICKLDDIIDDRITFVKMDIEGFELEALKGAENLIKRFRPKLAICIYHKFEDLYKLPMYIDGLGLGYKLYFRNYHGSASEAVMYAI